MANGDGLTEDQQRLLDQIAVLREEQPDDKFAWDAPEENPELASYLFDPDVLLVRTDDGDALGRMREHLENNGFGGLEQRELPEDDTGLPPLDMAHLVLPSTGDDEADWRRVPRALQLIDDGGYNDDPDYPLATPDHWMHLAAIGRLCPATEPIPTDQTRPWPEVRTPETLGSGVRVSIVDSGWNEDASAVGATADFLGGSIGGDPEPPGRAYACHGTFIAGVVRCLAPGAEIFVERFISGGSALRESHMVRQLRQTLMRDPHLINLSAGATTRLNRPMLSFERFWRKNLSLRQENCKLVAAAGNDAAGEGLWPAAFDWAIGVGSLDGNGGVSEFSNFGKALNVYALGQDVVNAFPDDTYTCRERPDKDDVRTFPNDLAMWSGTSFAAPVIVGLIAGELTPRRTVQEAWDAVLAQAEMVTSPEPREVPARKPPYT